MSEFYSNQDMDMDMDMEQTLSVDRIQCKEKYQNLKVELYHFFDSILLFDPSFHISRHEVKLYLVVENIMELCRLCHDFFLCRNISILHSAQHILEKLVIIDDSPKDEVFMYISAYTLQLLELEPHKHQELFDIMMDVSQYYELYMRKDIFAMIELEESIENLSF